MYIMMFVRDELRLASLIVYYQLIIFSYVYIIYIHIIYTYTYNIYIYASVLSIEAYYT